MNTFKKKTWRWLLLLAGGLVVVAASYPADDPAPPVEVPAGMLNGNPALPPPFSMYDVFRGAH